MFRVNSDASPPAVRSQSRFDAASASQDFGLLLAELGRSRNESAPGRFSQHSASFTMSGALPAVPTEEPSATRHSDELAVLRASRDASLRQTVEAHIQIEQLEAREREAAQDNRNFEQDEERCERLRRSAVAVVGDNGQPNSTGSPRLRPDDLVIGLYGLPYSFGQLLELPRQRQLGPPLTAQAMAYLQRLKAAAYENVGVADAIKIESDSDDDPPPEVPPVPAPAFVQPAEPAHEAGRRDDWCRLCLPASITDYEAVLQRGSPERGFSIDCVSTNNVRSKRCVRCTKSNRSCMANERGLAADRAWLAYMMNAVDDWIRARIEDGSAYLSEGCRHRLGKLILELATEFKFTQHRHRSSWRLVGSNKTIAANRAEYDAAMDRRVLILSRLKTNRPLQLGVDSCDDEYNAWLAAKVVFRKGVLDSICGEHPHMRERLEGELPGANQAV